MCDQLTALAPRANKKNPARIRNRPIARALHTTRKTHRAAIWRLRLTPSGHRKAPCCSGCCALAVAGARERCCSADALLLDAGARFCEGQ